MEAVLASVASSLIGSVAQSWFGKKEKAPEAPKVEAQPTMPDPGAQRKSKARRLLAMNRENQLTSGGTLMTGSDSLGA